MELCLRGARCELRRCVIGCVAFSWALFQLFTASPLPFLIAHSYGISWFVLTGFKARVIHLSFALCLLYLSVPFIRREGKDTSSGVDWVFSILALCSALYILVLYDVLSMRVAMPTNTDLVMSVLGILLLLEAARRVIGFPVTVVALSFLLYTIFGFIAPEVIAHKGHDIVSIASHEWLSSEGIFGVALGVSCNFVFLYVLFGALMDKAGAGAFFMRLSFALLRGSVGGPAKAAVVASGFMGMMSGSSVANTITIGSFTIPLMKKMGMSPEKAAAVEVSSGINGQVTPPVMGAAAFLMAEFLSLPYSDIVMHSLIPAIMVYIGLLAIVHFEACMLAPNGERATGGPSRYLIMILKLLICACSSVILFGTVYLVIYGVDIAGLHVPGVKDIFKGWSPYALAFLLMFTYVTVLIYRPRSSSEATTEDICDDDSSSGWEVFKQGLHYCIPVFVLVWSLVIEKASPSLACFWTNMFLMFMLLAEGVVESLRERDLSGIVPALLTGVKKISEAMVTSSRNMLPVAVATATAGIVVGTVGLTGFGLTIGSFVDMLAEGSVFIALVVTAIICIVLGMGMPTTGCYIVVSTLVVPALSAVAHRNGLSVPPVALHLFVLYFGLMADVTPPVGIASYAAAAIAHANSFKTGVQSFLYNVKTMVIPFMFVFNDDIILHDVKNPLSAAWGILLSIVSIVAICAGMQGYFIRRNRWYESIAFFCAGMFLVMPGHISGLLVSNNYNIPLTEISKATSVKEGDSVRINFTRRDSRGVSRHIVVPIYEGIKGNVKEILKYGVGIEVRAASDALTVFKVANNSYVASDIGKGDSITKLSINRKNNNGNYTVAFSLFVLLLLVLVQIRTKKMMRC